MATNNTLGIGGIHHVAIRTHDMAKSLDFYVGVLGFTVAADFDFEGMRFVHLRTTPGSAASGQYLELVEDGGEITPADERNVHWHLCFGTDRIEAAMAAAEAAGVEITMPVTPLELNNTAEGAAGPMHIQVAFFTGPSGEVVELLQE
ncbi:MAG: VOC family protein [Planctomycetota bacterium]